MPRAKVSLLSEEPDFYGYHYGRLPGDYRQINVRFEGSDGWVAYVAGEQVCCMCPTMEAAEQQALDFIMCNPVEREA